MKVFRKVVCWTCAVMLLTSSVACSKDAAKTSQGNNPQQTDQTKKAPDKVKIFTTTLGKEVPSVNDSMEIPTIKYIADKTNTILDVQFLDHNKYDDLLKVKFATGEFPDIWMGYGLGDTTDETQTQYSDITDLVKNAPNLKKNIPQESWDAVTVGGKIQAVPTPPDYNVSISRIFYVRKDWMDNVGIKSFPKTSDEYLDMLRAFRDKDPNGNGQKDELPFAGRQQFAWMEGIFNMWGITPFNFQLIDGKAMPGFAAPNMKKGLEMLATMYKEKLIDSESLSANSKEIWSNKIKSDKVGSWFNVPQSGDTWQNDVQSALPGKKVDVQAMPCPRGAGYTGPVGYISWPVSKLFFIPKASKAKEPAMRVLDWLGSEEGYIFSKYGFEGDTLIKQPDGKYKYDITKEKTNKTEWRSSDFTVVEIASFYDKLEQDPVLWPKKQAAFNVAKNEGVPNYLFALPISKAYSSDTEMQFIGKTIQEAMAKIMFGEKPASYWDEVMANWNKRGGDGIIKEATDWYNKNGKK